METDRIAAPEGTGGASHGSGDGGGATEGNSDGITLFNVYGTTEGTVYQMSYRILPFAAAGHYPAATDVSAVRV